MYTRRNRTAVGTNVTTSWSSSVVQQLNLNQLRVQPQPTLRTTSTEPTLDQPSATPRPCHVRSAATVAASLVVIVVVRQHSAAAATVATAAAAATALITVQAPCVRQCHMNSDEFPANFVASTESANAERRMYGQITTCCRPSHNIEQITI